MDKRRRRQGFSGKQHPAKGREVVLAHDVEIRHQVEDRGHREPLCEPGFANELCQLMRQEIELRGHQVQLCPRPKSAEHVERGYVETQRRVLRDAIGVDNAEVRQRPADEMRDARVGDHHALGDTCGTRREQNVRHVAFGVGAGGRRRRIGGEVVQGEERRRIDFGGCGSVQPSDHRPLGERRNRQRVAQILADRAGGEYAAAVADLEHPRLPRCGTRRIHRHVDRIGFQRAEHGHDRLKALRHQQTDAISPPAACLLQRTGEPVARFLERTVGEAGAFEYERGRLRSRLCLRRHALL